MKYISIVIASLFIYSGAFAIEPDKAQHFIASGVISTTLYAGFRLGGVNKLESYTSAVAVSLTIGVLKEISDDRFDKEDMKFNALGAVLMPVFILEF